MTEYKFISVIVAAKNEEAFIRKFLTSIKKLTYPAENYEIILVDDGSTDKTSQFARECKVPNLKIVKAIDKRFPGKKGALDLAMKHSKGSYFAVTDADCVVGKNWLESINSLFVQGYDMILGTTNYTPGDTDVSKYAAFERYRNLLLSQSAAKINLPYTVGASSFAFTKEIFEKTGGYEKTLQTASGDDDLLLTLAKRQNARIVTLLDQDSLVSTNSPQNFTDYFNTKRRHVSTSVYYTLPSQLYLGLWHWSSLILTLSLPLALFFTPAFIYFLFRFIIEISLFRKFSGFFQLRLTPVEIFFHILRYDFFAIYVFISRFFVKPVWK